jgi:hypothetical protein
MRTRSAVAGAIVALMVGGLGAGPVGAEDEPGATTTEPAASAVATDPAPPPANGGDEGSTAGDGDTAPGPGEGATTGSGDPAPLPSDPPPAGPPPADAGAAPPAAGSAPPPTTPPSTSASPPAASAPTSAPGATSPSTTSGGAPSPSVVSSQDATVDAAGSAVADTGHNTAANGTVQVIVVDQAAVAPGDGAGGSADPAAGNTAGGGNTGVGLALVVTGDASAIGGTTDDSISQKALVKAVGTGEIEIIQIALVVNLGVGVANTGANTATGLDAVNVIGIGQGAAAGPGGAGGVSTNGLTAANDASGAGAITTGNATAVGNANDVRVVQAANVAAGTGIVASGQATDITSLGVAFGNTGLNIVIGNTVVQLILVDQAAGGGGGSAASATNQATATNAATGMAGITTGTAAATGLASSTAIDQVAMADAGDGGFVSILQRALVLNLGLALANTGMNDAVGNQSVNLVDVQQQSIAGAFWASLQSLFGGSGWLDLTGASGTTVNTVTAANTSDGAALVTTGDATATGLASTTQVGQTAAGSAQAGGQALVTQDATVTNGGLAVANTGGNAAAGLLALNAVVTDQWAGLGAYLTEYLAQLGSGATTATPTSSSWALGDVLVDLFGEIHADEILIDGFAGLSGGQVEAAVAQALGFADGFGGIAGSGPTATGPRIRVRQITGTLTINLGIAATGGNRAQTSTVNVVVVDQQADAASDAQVSNALGQGVRAAVQAVADGTLAGDAALDPANLAVLINATTGAAVVVTGDAAAGNSTVIAVCQTFETPVAVCSPPEPPATPPADPSGDPAATGGSGRGAGGTGAARARAVVATGWSRGVAPASDELPRTGSDTVPLAQAGAVLVAAGALLVLAAGRRRALQGRPAPGAGPSSRRSSRPATAEDGQ